MNIYGSNRLSWKSNALYFQKELMFSAVKDDTYETMYRVKWPDGVLSENMYNFFRARNHCIILSLSTLNNT